MGGWFGERSSGDPRPTNKNLVPVGIAAISTASRNYNPHDLNGLSAWQEMSYLNNNPHFKPLLDLYNKEYLLRKGIGGQEANKAFLNGALYVHCILRNQAGDEIPKFSQSDVSRIVGIEMEEIKNFALRNTINDEYLEQIAIQRFNKLIEENEDPNLARELLNQSLTRIFFGPFIVGAMAAYFSIRTLWAEKQKEKEKMKQRLITTFRRGPEDTEDPISLFENLRDKEAVIFDESGNLPSIPAIRLN